MRIRPIWLLVLVFLGLIVFNRLSGFSSADAKSLQDRRELAHRLDSLEVVVRSLEQRLR